MKTRTLHTEIAAKKLAKVRFGRCAQALMWAILTVACIAAAGSIWIYISASSATAFPSVEESPILLDFCTSTPADGTFYVPKNWVGDTFTSGSGFYGYRVRCPFFLQDILMTRTSACDPTTGSCWNLTVDGGPYDLPSSGPANVYQGLPKNKEDCERLATWMRIYTKPAYQSAFTLVDSEHYKGSWTNSGCQLNSVSLWGSRPDLTQNINGWYTYRIAVAVKLRTSYQEAAVSASPPPPK